MHLLELVADSVGGRPVLGGSRFGTLCDKRLDLGGQRIVDAVVLNLAGCQQVERENLVELADDISFCRAVSVSLEHIVKTCQSERGVEVVVERFLKGRDQLLCLC